MPHTESTPVSDAQLAANRANAARSSGPRTQEGKARSAQNARKHGFTGSTFAVVRLEDINEINRLRDDAVAVFQPVNSQELFAVERIAIAQQCILRAARLESGLFTTCLNETVDERDRPMMMLSPTMFSDDISITKAQNRNYFLGEGFYNIAKKSNALGLMLRYQAQAERLYRRAVEEFDRLKALRNELPNEPISGPQLEEPETHYTDSQTNPIPPGNPFPTADPTPPAQPTPEPAPELGPEPATAPEAPAIPQPAPTRRSNSKPRAKARRARKTKRTESKRRTAPAPVRSSDAQATRSQETPERSQADRAKPVTGHWPPATGPEAADPHVPGPDLPTDPAEVQ